MHKSGVALSALAFACTSVTAQTESPARGRVLVDGGIVRNLPVDVARALGAERIIAVDISTRLGELESQSMFSVA